MIVFLDGAYVESERAVSAEDRGLLLGHGAFETIYVEGGACAFLDAHLERLRCGLRVLGIAFNSDIDVRGVAKNLADRNGVDGRGALRLTVTGGPAGRGPDGRASATLLITLTPIERATRPITISLASYARCAGSIAARCKLIGGYVDNLAALAEARSRGFDEAIMLNEHGDVACATVANLFLIAPDGVVATPRVADGALPGVVRGLLLGGAHGVKITERAIRPEEVANGGIFLTNSLRGVAPCAGADASVQATQALERLQSWYSDALADDLRRGLI
jgi:branched-subunit amino acid aminotransferase/4-amino-4-deoxychorismate lyase